MLFEARTLFTVLITDKLSFLPFLFSLMLMVQCCWLTSRAITRKQDLILEACRSLSLYYQVRWEHPNKRDHVSIA
jgi:hypothetical protein